MSGFWEKAGDFASKSYKKLNEFSKAYAEEKSKYQKIAAKMNDRELKNAYKNSTAHPIRHSCFEKELIKRGLIKPNTD